MRPRYYKTWILTLFLFTLAATIEAKTNKSKQTRRPVKNIRSISFAQEKEAQKHRAQTLRLIKKTLKQTPNKSARYELLKRYGELYVEQAEYAYTKEQMIYDRAYEQWIKNGAPEDKEPKMDNSTSRRSLETAINIYRQIARDYSDYPDIDITLYELGKSLLQLDKEEGIRYLSQLIKTKPKSAFVQDAYFEIGEWYFNKHDMIKAKPNYEKAAAKRQHPIYPYAIYKLGWTYYNYPAANEKEEEAKFRRAVKAFKLVVTLTKTFKDTQKANFLRDQAINDLIMVWAELEDIDGAWSYFKRIGEQDSFYKMLERLGNIYMENGADDKAIVVFQRILKERPLRTENYVSHKKLVDAYHNLHNYKQVAQELSKMTQLYVQPKSSWFKANQQNKDEMKSAHDAVEFKIHFYATTYHKDAQRTRKKTFYKLATYLYTLYLKNFPQSDKVYSFNFYLAEALYELKKYEQAAHYYLQVARIDQKQKQKGPYYQASLENAVLALNDLVASKKWPKLPKAGTIRKPLTIPREKIKLRKALDLYVKLLPQHPKAPAMALAAAEITYQYGHYPEALQRLEQLALQFRKTKESKTAIEALLKHLNDQKDWPTLIAKSRLFLNTKDTINDPKLRAYTLGLLKYGLFTYAYELGKDSKNAQAAQAFLAYQKEFPQDKKAPDAVYNAMVLYFKEGDVENAFNASKIALKSYPRFDKKPNIVFAVSEAYEGLGQYQKAAEFYRLFAKLWPKDPRAADMLYSSGILYGAESLYTHAEESFRQFLTAYPQHKLASEARLELAKTYDQLKDQQKAAAIYKQIIQFDSKKRPDDAALARVKLALMTHPPQTSLWQYQSVKQLIQWFQQKNSPDALIARRLLSEALFNELDPSLKEFLTQQIVINELAQIEQALVNKQKSLEQLVQGYQTILTLGHPEFLVACDYRLGQIHEAFAKAIDGIKLPNQTDPKTAKIVRTQLDDLAKPLYKSAQDFYEKAYKSSLKYLAFTPWSVFSFDKLAQWQKDKYPAMGEMYIEPGYTTHSIGLDAETARELNEKG